MFSSMKEECETPPPCVVDRWATRQFDSKTEKVPSLSPGQVNLMYKDIITIICGVLIIIINITCWIRYCPRRRSWPDFVWSLSLPRLAIFFDHMHPFSTVHFSSSHSLLAFSTFASVFLFFCYHSLQISNPSPSKPSLSKPSKFNNWKFDKLLFKQLCIFLYTWK